MTTEFEPERIPELSVSARQTPDRGPHGLGAVLVDGTVPIAVGGAMASGFGVEAAHDTLAADANAWWMIVLFVVGLALLTLGFWLSRRRPKVGIVVSALDSAPSAGHGRSLDQAAEDFSREHSRMTLRVAGQLAGDDSDAVVVDLMADQVHGALDMARRLVPAVTRVDLFPTLRLHAAFRLGARLGYTQPAAIAVYQGKWPSGYFAAVPLKVMDLTESPLVEEPRESIAGCDPARVALAVDLQNRGQGFRAQVLDACRRDGIGTVLRLRHPASTLAEDEETFAGVVAQTWRLWRDAGLTEAARTGQHAIFLSGPVAIAVALGARFAAADAGRWTAYTWDAEQGCYVSMPAGSPSAPPAGS